jgi:transposase
LQIKNMTCSARGTIEKPGVNVRAKSGLNRSILGMAWSKTERMLAYKCLWEAGVLIRVRAEYSSQTCARCGEVAEESRQSRDWFCCVVCGHRAPADTNAAQVLLARGLAAHSGTAPGRGVAGRGALAGRQAVKRQPPAAAMAHALLSGNYPCRLSTGRTPKAGYHDYYYYGGKVPLLGMAEFAAKNDDRRSMDRRY